MSVAGSQAQTFLRLLQPLRARWRSDPSLPRTLQSLLAAERRFGSRDRRLYRELIYTTLRYLPWIEPSLAAAPAEAVRRVAWLAADTPATRLFRAEFATGEPPAGDATELLPAWFREHGPELFESPEAAFQLRRAPLWLRLQTDEAGRAQTLAEFSARGWECRPSALLPDALEVRTEADVTQTESWRAGRVEVQDLGSQLLLEAAGIDRGEHWLDACAGAGGKTLQLARLLGPEGQVDAHDIRKAALDELRVRAARARLRNIRVVTATPASAYAGVLVDAPCSGSGTWRRSPHLKWTITPATIAEKAALQTTLLARFAPTVRAGGRLIYATCSLSRQENEHVVAAFLRQHPDFEPAPFRNTFGFGERGGGLTLLPSRHDTDGFFVANLRRR
jgi:16S rRNA (cytosine967-C5)-methyltransferase